MTCVCVWRGAGRCGWKGGEWMRKLGLGFTNYVGAGGVLDMLRWCGWCKWGVGRGLGPGSGAVGWYYVCVGCGSGFSV